MAVIALSGLVFFPTNFDQTKFYPYTFPDKTLTRLVLTAGKNILKVSKTTLEQSPKTLLQSYF